MFLQTFTIVFNSSIEQLDPTVLDYVHAVAYIVEEVLVVRYHDQATLECLECHDKGVNCIEVEMVSRLIEK